MTSVLIASGLITGGAAFSFTLFFRRGKILSDRRWNVAAKILSLIFAACFVLRLAMTDVFYETEALVGIFSKGLNFLLVALRALTQMCVLALVLAPWFNFRAVKNIVAYAVPAVYFVDMVLFRQNVYAFVGAGDDARRAPLHSDRFDFDERALLPAVDWYTRIIETFAKED